MTEKKTNPDGIIKADELYTVDVARLKLGVSPNEWATLLKKGVPFTKIGRRRFVFGEDLMKWIRSQAETKTACC